MVKFGRKVTTAMNLENMEYRLEISFLPYPTALCTFQRIKRTE